MLNAHDLLNIIKKASIEAMEATKPSDFCFGTVTSDSPLKILVEQKMTLTSAQLVLARNVTDFKINYKSGEEIKEVTIQNALKNGEKVILLKQKGGQKYLVLDRVVNVS